MKSLRSQKHPEFLTWGMNPQDLGHAEQEH